MSLQRTAKLNSEFQKNIYEVLSKSVKDPRITEMFSVTKVETDKELTLAKVYISVYGKDSEKTEETFEGIKSAAGYVRRELYKIMRVRAVPQLMFVRDDSMEYSDRISKILNQLNITEKDEEEEGQ